jgi:hypothetical protein
MHMTQLRIKSEDKKEYMTNWRRYAVSPLGTAA